MDNKILVKNVLIAIGLSAVLFLVFFGLNAFLGMTGIGSTISYIYPIAIVIILIYLGTKFANEKISEVVFATLCYAIIASIVIGILRFASISLLVLPPMYSQILNESFEIITFDNPFFIIGQIILGLFVFNIVACFIFMLVGRWLAKTGKITPIW